MSVVINGLINASYGITGTKLWSSLSFLVPYIIITFLLSFGLSKLRDWIRHNQIINDPDCLGYYDRKGKYHHLRDPEYYE